MPQEFRSDIKTKLSRRKRWEGEGRVSSPIASIIRARSQQRSSQLADRVGDVQTFLAHKDSY